VQILVGDIPTLRTPAGWDPTTPVNIFIDTDGSVTFGLGYHRWEFATEDENILLGGGGPDDGDLFLIQSYRSELGGVTAGLAVLGTLSRSDLIIIASATFLCDNESAVLSINMPLTDSIFNHIDGDHDVVSTIKDLQENLGLEITYEWVKGHADDISDKHCDLVRKQARGLMSATSSTGQWDGETCALFIQGSKITGHMKERLT
jgi:ribonuclease HI